MNQIQFISMECRVQSQASPCGICGGESHAVTSFAPRIVVLSCQHHFKDVSYSHVIQLPPMLNIASN